MSERIKVGDVYLELPKGLPKTPIITSAEKSETPEALDIPAFAYNRHDAVQMYIEGANKSAQQGNTSRATKDKPDTMAEWSAFCGATSKIAQYWQQYQSRQSKDCGFNIFAALFGINWFFWNKMYVNGIICAIVEVWPLWTLRVAMSSYQETGFSIKDPGTLAIALALFTLSRIGIGFWANFALYRRANREIAKIRSFDLDATTHLSLVRSAGEAAIVPVLILTASIAAITLILNPL